MNGKIKIAITGVGGGVGQSVIKSLYDTEYHLVGLDGEALGTGVFALPDSYQIPYAKSPDYIDKLFAICEKEKVRLLFPGLDAELMPLSLNRDKFSTIGTTLVVSDPDVIRISDDKLYTYDKLTPHGISVPLTMDLDKYIADPKLIDFPLIVKQKVGGARSKNVFLIKTKADLDNLLARKGLDYSEFVAQEYIEGEEFTCGSVNLGGKCRGVIVMKRTLRDGDTYKCFSLRNERIEFEVRKIMDIIKPFGACNVQLRMKDDKPYVFEINARCSGTTAARTLCGFNEPKMVADYLIRGTEPSYHIKELSILRYWKELVIPNEVVREFQQNKDLHKSSYARL